MSNKRLFQVFDEMNVNDEKNKTAMLPCAFTMVEAKSDKRGGLITMGVEGFIVQKIFLGEMQPVLVVMDKKEYHRLEKEPIEDYATKLHQVEKERDELLRQNDKMKAMATGWRPLLEKVIHRHEGGLLPDRILYLEIKKFLYGE